MTWSSHHWPIVVCLKSRSLKWAKSCKIANAWKKRPFLNIWLVALPYICENWENLLHFFICISNFCDLKSFFIPNFLGIEYFLVYKWLRKKRKLNHHNYLNIQYRPVANTILCHNLSTCTILWFYPYYYVYI